jgi:hypothetical protein
VVTGANSFVMVIRAIRSKIKVFRIIRVSRVMLIVFRCSWDVLWFLALLFLIRLLQSLGLFKFLELLRVLRLLRLQFYIVIKTLSVIAMLVGFLVL